MYSLHQDLKDELTLKFIKTADDLSIIDCNAEFTRFCGYQTADILIGCTIDKLSCFPNKAKVLHTQHEMDALNGKFYNQIIPLVDAEDCNLLGIESIICTNDKKNRKIITCSIFKISDLYLCTKENPIAKPSDISQPIMEILTEKETEVLMYFLKRNSVKVIAKKLNLSIKTVHNHICSIKEKLFCLSTSDVVDKAITEGLVYLLPQDKFLNQLIVALDSLDER